MERTLVTYFSHTGNTKKVAEAIYENIQGEKQIKSFKEVEKKDFEDYDLIFIGFPVHSHSVPIVMESFIKKIPPNKKIAFFSTHGSLTGSRLSREAIEHATVLAAKAKLLGSFSCRGKVSLEALEYLEKSPEHKAWTDMAASANTHPDENDLNEAGSFAKWIMTLASQE
ncbi:MAG: flavodoxin family protein [Candidatus Aminicenantes bacterium]